MMTTEKTEFRYRTLSEGVESVIRRMILQGELAPGERINEVQLAEQLEMSRGPIREALRRLQSQGLVIYHPHRGTFVSELSHEDAREVYTLRAILETGAVRLAIEKLQDEDFSRLEEIAQRFETAHLAKDVNGIIQADMDFHHMIVQKSGNSRLYEVYRSLDTQLGTMFIAIQSGAPERVSRLSKMHLDLVEALRSRDVTRACNEFEEHYLSAWRALTRNV